MNNFFKYGEEVEGYNVRVLNEREARAAAGILFFIGIMSLNNAIMLGNGIVTRFFIAFFAFDFIIRVINARYSPSLLIGRFFVRNQKPEYVGATQKRFAWLLGSVLAIPMSYFISYSWDPNPITLLVCVICLTLLFLESAFGVCVGCNIYSMIMPKPPENCPGGSCEFQIKENVQKFNIGQSIVAVLTLFLFVYGIHSYLYKIENKTFFGKMVSQKLLTEEGWKKRNELEYQKSVDEFNKEDDFFDD